MNNDFLDHINAVGKPDLFDSMISMDFLMTAKTGVRNCAVALTEAATPELRATIRKQMADSIKMHDKISELMIKNGWLHPYNLSQQFKMDELSTDTTLKIAELELFPGVTSRLGTFATPEK